MRIFVWKIQQSKNVPCSLPIRIIIGENLMRRILEAGHYYCAKGPTQWAKVGWEIAKELAHNGDKTMLFIDDVHDISNVSVYEVDMPVISLGDCRPHYTIRESEVESQGLQILEQLKNIPSKKRRAELQGTVWYCSGAALTNGKGKPSCVLLDAGLSLVKQQFGFQSGINILPEFYQDQQEKLLRIVKKALPDFQLQVILYDLDGKWHYL
ncbi:MAG: hypothetical protein A3E60_03375 [Candidatus Kerfeldbacteria bacterium RIFCSPHIGHO2_12_FULL_42_13]|nr:MAG: hypothetical protein A3E60_03375 [Candidatus Kerfeldbacteria bacterium RIFCSPHIGHO2_12_FULL_42_13]